MAELLVFGLVSTHLPVKTLGAKASFCHHGPELQAECAVEMMALGMRSRNGNRNKPH